jgi:hypothetical protein
MGGELLGVDRPALVARHNRIATRLVWLRRIFACHSQSQGVAIAVYSIL